MGRQPSAVRPIGCRAHDGATKDSRVSHLGKIDFNRLQPNTRMAKLDLGPITRLDSDGYDTNLDDGSRK